MSKGVPAASRDARSETLWSDLEAFGRIVDGLRLKLTLQQIGEHPGYGFGSSRMVYLRLERLERTLRQRFIDRRRWGREAYLTRAGETLSTYVQELLAVRRKLHAALAETETPSLRIATHATFIALFLPAIIDHRRRSGKPPGALVLEPSIVREFPEAVAAIVDGRADVAFYMSPPGAGGRAVHLPRGVRGEPLIDSVMLVLCAPTHRFAARLRRNPAATVSLHDLADEIVIGRPFFRNLTPPPTARGGWIEVPHSLDMLMFVRLGIGVGFHSRLSYDLLGKPRDIVAIPLSPQERSSLWLLRPRKRLRMLGETAEDFIEDSRTFILSLARRNSRNR